MGPKQGREKTKGRKHVAHEVSRFLDAWFAVRQFIQASNFNRFQRAGLSATQFMTLNLLPADGEGIAMGELARRMNLKPATVAKTVDSLESREMIARTKSTSDKRSIFVKITENGTKLQNAANGQFKKQIGELFEAMLPEERSGLIVGLESFLRVSGNGAGHAQPSARANRVVGAAPPAKRNSKRSPRP